MPARKKLRRLKAARTPPTATPLTASMTEATSALEEVDPTELTTRRLLLGRLESAFAIFHQLQVRVQSQHGPDPPYARFRRYFDQRMAPYGFDSKLGQLPPALFQPGQDIEGMVAAFEECMDMGLTLLHPVSSATPPATNENQDSTHDTVHTLSSRELAGHQSLPTDTRSFPEALEAMASLSPLPIAPPASSSTPACTAIVKGTPSTPAQAQATTSDCELDAVLSLMLTVFIQIVSLELLAMDLIQRSGVAIGRVTTTAVVQTLAWVSVLLGFVPKELQFLITAKLESRLRESGALARLIIVPAMFVVAVFGLPAYRLYDVGKITLRVVALIKEKASEQQRVDGVDNEPSENYSVTKTGATRQLQVITCHSDASSEDVSSEALQAGTARLIELFNSLAAHPPTPTELP